MGIREGEFDRVLRLEKEGKAFLSERDPAHLSFTRWYRLTPAERGRSWLVVLQIAGFTLVAASGGVAPLLMRFVPGLSPGGHSGAFVLLGMPLMLVGLSGAVWAATQSTRRGRRAFAQTQGLPCPGCGHDLGSVPEEEVRCPECGARLAPRAVIANWVKKYKGLDGRLKDPPAWMRERERM